MLRAIPWVLVAMLLVACTPQSKGTMPPAGPNEVVDPSTVPEFVAVAGPAGGAIGYARREDVLGNSDAPFPVYADDLRSVVGTMVPGRGFVPLGVDPQAVPTLEVVVAPASEPAQATGAVALYVRNDFTELIWVAVDGQAVGATGFLAENLGVGCYLMAPGSSLLVMDRAPTTVGARPVSVVYVRGLEQAPRPRWIVISEDGSLSQGTGVPAWWGTPQSC